MRKNQIADVVIILVLIVSFSSANTLADSVQSQPTPLEEAILKIRPAVGVLYQLINVYDKDNRLIRNYYSYTGDGTLTVFETSPTASCAISAAHTTSELNEVILQRNQNETHRFSGRYFATFDGKHMIEITVAAKRGKFQAQDDFAVFRIPEGNMPTVKLGDESMVRDGTQVFSVSSPAVIPGGILATSTVGYVARVENENFPTVGSGLPEVRHLFIIDIRMSFGSSGALVYVVRKDGDQYTGYAFAMLDAFFTAGTPAQEVGQVFPYALGITRFKNFVQEENVLSLCLK